MYSFHIYKYINKLNVRKHQVSWSKLLLLYSEIRLLNFMNPTKFLGEAAYSTLLLNYRDSFNCILG